MCVSAGTEAELRFACMQCPMAKQLAALVEEFLMAVDSLPWDSDAAKSYAELRTHCKETGLVLGCMDMLIAAHAITVNARLITSDKAFSRLSGLLPLENWQAT